MKLKEFLEELERTPRRWKLEESWRGVGAITDQWDRCPIEAAGKARNVVAAQQRLKLNRRTEKRIIHAADGALAFPDYDPKLRAQLLKACGLAPHTREGVK